MSENYHHPSTPCGTVGILDLAKEAYTGVLRCSAKLHKPEALRVPDTVGSCLERDGLCDVQPLGSPQNAEMLKLGRFLAKIQSTDEFVSSVNVIEGSEALDMEISSGSDSGGAPPCGAAAEQGAEAPLERSSLDSNATVDEELSRLSELIRDVAAKNGSGELGRDTVESRLRKGSGSQKKFAHVKSVVATSWKSSGTLSSLSSSSTASTTTVSTPPPAHQKKQADPARRKAVASSQKRTLPAAGKARERSKSAQSHSPAPASFARTSSVNGRVQQHGSWLVVPSGAGTPVKCKGQQATNAATPPRRLAKAKSLGAAAKLRKPNHLAPEQETGPVAAKKGLPLSAHRTNSQLFLDVLAEEQRESPRCKSAGSSPMTPPFALAAGSRVSGLMGARFRRQDS